MPGELLRVVCSIGLVAACAGAAGEENAGPSPPYPLWDGQESVADYATRAGLPPTETLDLGGGTKLELVLVPAGRFRTGVPEPDTPGVWSGVATLGGLTALALVIQVIIRTWLRRREAVKGIEASRRERRLRVLWRAVSRKAPEQAQSLTPAQESSPPRRRVLLPRPQFSLRWLLAFSAGMGFLFASLARWESAQRLHDLYAGEFPEREITINRPFYMSRCELTQEQYASLKGRPPSVQWQGLNLPVVTEGWVAVQFCSDLAERARRKVRLPTEDEWEHACRAGTPTVFSGGDMEQDLAVVAWYAGNSGGTVHPVGQREPNAFGLYDMHGNVCEWFLGGRAPEAVSSSPLSYVFNIRGGGAGSSAHFCRSGCRAQPSRSHECVITLAGIRVVMEVQEK